LEIRYEHSINFILLKGQGIIDLEVGFFKHTQTEYIPLSTSLLQKYLFASAGTPSHAHFFVHVFLLIAGAFGYKMHTFLSHVV